METLDLQSRDAHGKPLPTANQRRLWEKSEEMNSMTANHAWRAHGEIDAAVVVRFASPWAVSTSCAQTKRLAVATIRDDGPPSGLKRGDP
ncbi:MAG: hypothetical protein FJ144_04255 [Deltaproteobacteria bacterium]|nr:hypothetical protein [Deltaproteobacteria bacterium]